MGGVINDSFLCAAIPEGRDVLGETVLVVADQRTGRLDDARDGPIIGGHMDDLAPRKVLVKGQHDGRHSSAEPINGLVVITDHAQVFISSCQQVKDLFLDGVRVLVFIADDEPEFLLELMENVRHFRKDPLPVYQQVVKIQPVHAFFVVLICFCESLELHLRDGELGTAF